MLLERSPRYTLTRNMRSRNAQLDEILGNLRNAEQANPVTTKVINAIKQLSTEDMRSNPAWLLHPRGVQSHLETRARRFGRLCLPTCVGDHLNFTMLKNYCKLMKVPLVRWKRKLKFPVLGKHTKVSCQPVVHFSLRTRFLFLPTHQGHNRGRRVRWRGSREVAPFTRTLPGQPAPVILPHPSRPRTLPKSLILINFN